MPDYLWIKDLKPEEARAALAALDARENPMTVGEVMELRRLRLRLEAKVKNGMRT
jgi:hypothetical protein